jgi:RNA-directed DNA polymerase
MPRGCPLSPLLAGFHLYELDQQLAKRNGVRYCRFMDDLLIISKTRWQLRRAITIMNKWFEMAALIT